MEKARYIKQLKLLIKKYHPDLCAEKHLESRYHDLTVKLNSMLDRLKSGEPPVRAAPARGSPPSDKAYGYYKQGVHYYRNIHPDRFFNRGPNGTYAFKTYKEQLGALGDIFISFNLAEHCFSRVAAEYPESPWASDAKEKLLLLRKLRRRYEERDITEGSRLIDTAGFVTEMGLNPMF